MIKVLTSNADYNPGNFTVDLFGVNYEAPLEINIPISTWNEVFGANTMPQEGDVIYIKIMHKLFEVRSSQIIYQIASMPVYFKCQLAKYNQKASRKETEEFHASIEAITVSEQDLFGDAISQEVADNNVEVETAYETTTYQDPFKDFDIDSIVYEPMYGTNGVLISNAYYDFSISSKSVTYDIQAHYLAENSERPHWIYTSWFRTNDDPTAKKGEYSVRKLIFYMKDKQYWYFKILTPLKLKEGNRVVISRGKLIKVEGTVTDLRCENMVGIRFKASDMLKLNKKLSNWWESGIFKISKTNTIVTTDGDLLKIDVNEFSSTINLTFGKTTKTLTPKKNIDFSKWTYIAIDFCYDEIRVVIQQLMENGNHHTKVNELVDETMKSNLTKSGEFSFEKIILSSPSNNINIRNIRLYENEYPMEDTYKQDMFSAVTRNASKLILVDAPNVPTDAKFYTPIR